MAPEKFVSFLMENLADYVSFLFRSLCHPNRPIRAMAQQYATAKPLRPIIGLPAHEPIESRLNPRLFVFLLLSILFGFALESCVPGRTKLDLTNHACLPDLKLDLLWRPDVDHLPRNARSRWILSNFVNLASVSVRHLLCRRVLRRRSWRDVEVHQHSRLDLHCPSLSSLCHLSYAHRRGSARFPLAQTDSRAGTNVCGPV